MISLRMKTLPKYSQDNNYNRFKHRDARRVYQALACVESDSTFQPVKGEPMHITYIFYVPKRAHAGDDRIAARDLPDNLVYGCKVWVDELMKQFGLDDVDIVKCTAFKQYAERGSVTILITQDDSVS